MNSAMILRSPMLADGGDVRVVRLYAEPEPVPFRNGGLSRAASRGVKEALLHITPSEYALLQRRWGAPALNPNTRVPEYRFADGGAFRELTMPTGDWYTYGERPEHQFFTGSIPTPPVKVGVPTTPTGPSAQQAPTGSGGLGGTLAGLIGAAGSVNSIGKALGFENPIKSGLGALGNLLGIGGGISPEWGTGEMANDEMSRVLKEMMDPTKPMNAAAPGGGGGLLSYLDRGATGVGGALDVIGGLQQGGIEGVGRSLEGASDVAKAFGKDIPGLGVLGDIGGILQADFSNPVSALKSVGSAAGLAGNFLGSSALSGIGAVAAPLALGFAGVQMLNKALNGHGDEKRNSAAFQAAFPGTEFLRVPGGRNLKAFAKLPDGRLISMDDYEKLAGAWYGATYAPDGDQERWAREYASLNAMPGQESALNAGLLSKLRPIKVAEGGALSRFVRGPGTGRSDSIPAQLSDGEYVLTAEDVALIGDGSSEAGARRLDQMREQLRRHKGAALAKGKISPDARPPLEYLRGVT